MCISICGGWTIDSWILREVIWLKVCFESIVVLGIILRTHFGFVDMGQLRDRRVLVVWLLFNGPGNPFVHFPSSRQSTHSPPQFVKDELLPVVTAENLLKRTLLEDNGPQIYCGTALNFIKSVLDYAVSPELREEKFGSLHAVSVIDAQNIWRTFVSTCSLWVHNVWMLK